MPAAIALDGGMGRALEKLLPERCHLKGDTGVLDSAFSRRGRRIRNWNRHRMETFVAVAAKRSVRSSPSLNHSCGSPIFRFRFRIRTESIEFHLSLAQQIAERAETSEG